MDTQRIVSELKAERNRLDKAIAVLDGANTTRTVAKHVILTNGAKAPRKGHRLTAAGRKRLSMLMKKRWAERRKKGLAGQKQMPPPAGCRPGEGMVQLSRMCQGDAEENIKTDSA